MRVSVLAVALLLAGCATAEEPTQATPHAEQPVSPAPDDASTPQPASPARDPLVIEDEGDMTEGVDETWAFSLDENVTALTVIVTLGGMDGIPVQADTAVQVTLSQDNVQAAAEGDDAITLYGGTTTEEIFRYDEASDDRMPDHAGDWTLRLDADRALAHYAISIKATFD